VYAATGLENKLTVVDGQELYRDGQFLTCDYSALCAELSAAQGWHKGKN
jgi:5-methylthioadenosine/S-adenosylhomocysteine deaminase